MELPKNYDFNASEKKWIEYWKSQNIFKFMADSKKKLFSIDTPPPTVSGKMHVGHAFSYSHEDFIARYKRMKGFNVLFPFGTDDNGLPTIKLVENLKNVNATKMPAKDFRDLCYKAVNEIHPGFINDWIVLGMSCDFSKVYSTIDPSCQKKSQEMFIDLYEKGLLKREETPMAWDTYFQSSIAQAEFENVEMESEFNSIIFQCHNKDLIIATTRPELLCACVALFFHPDDKRYKYLKGKSAKVPIFGYDVPIMSDESVDKEKGTGLMMVCTFGDKEDIEKYFKYNLPIRVCITKEGKMNEHAGPYQGLEIKDARKKIIHDLKKQNLLVKQEKIVHNVNVYEKSGREIEFLVSKQWFINVLNKKEELIELAEKINWHPNHMKARYIHWVQNLNWDWSISRQRSFGVPFPVWYEKDTGKIILADRSQLPVDPTVDNPKNYKGDPENLVPETDTLDTWATSSLTPIMGFGIHGLDEKNLPMDLRPQAHDIIRTWAFYTIVRGDYNFKTIPWKNIMISGFVTDPHGKKMSKSKGNVVDPKELLEKYGADVLRYWSAGGKLGDDLPFLEKEFVAGKKTVTKLWNAIKFTIMNLEGYKKEKPKKLCDIDSWILSKAQKLVQSCTESMENYEYSKTRMETDIFFWQAYCDYYLEIVKDRIYNKETYEKDKVVSAQYTLYNVSLTILKLFAPIMPFITEELFDIYYKNFEKDKSIAVSQWPEYDKKLVDEYSEKKGDAAMQIISAVRKFKSNKQWSIKKEISRVAVKSSVDIKGFIDDIKAVCNAKEVVVGKAAHQISEGLFVDVEE